jgi:hypothetical protein
MNGSEVGLIIKETNENGGVSWELPLPKQAMRIPS